MTSSLPSLNNPFSVDSLLHIGSVSPSEDYYRMPLIVNFHAGNIDQRTNLIFAFVHTVLSQSQEWGIYMVASGYSDFLFPQMALRGFSHLEHSYQSVRDTDTLIAAFYADPRPSLLILINAFTSKNRNNHNNINSFRREIMKKLRSRYSDHARNKIFVMESSIPVNKEVDYVPYHWWSGRLMHFRCKSDVASEILIAVSLNPALTLHTGSARQHWTTPYITYMNLSDTNYFFDENVCALINAIPANTPLQWKKVAIQGIIVRSNHESHT